ncbi:MAG: DUF2029 domain-containing protein [Myxococcales bacterium]|nr:DUF2029 domain-containing protein [Myxococcales bacterium]
MIPRPAAGIALCIAGGSALSWLRFALTGTLAVDGAGLPGTLALALGLGFGVCAAGAAVLYLHALREAEEAATVSWRGLVAGAVLIHLAAAPALPCTSNDLFSNLAYARLAALGHNPYLASPHSLPPGDPFAALVGARWLDTPIVYGPILTALDGAIGHIASFLVAVAAFKLVFVACGLALVGAAWGFCRTLPGGRGAASFVLIAWSPLLAWEVTAQAHNDGAMVLALALFAWAAMARREWIALLCLVGAVLAKFAALPLLFLYLCVIARRAPLRAIAMAAAAVGLAALAFAPYWAGPATLRAAVTAASGETARTARSLVDLLYWAAHPLGVAAARWVYEIGRAAGFALLSFLGLRAALRARTVETMVREGLLLLIVYCLVTPWFQPWYATWILPLAMVDGDPRWRRLCALYTALSIVQYALPIDPVSSVAIHAVAAWRLRDLLRAPIGIAHGTAPSPAAVRSPPMGPAPDRAPSVARRVGPWLAWCFVVFVVGNSFATHDEQRQTDLEHSRPTWHWSARNIVREIRTYGTDDGDILRYFAYCNAALGRPHSGYFVRTTDEWLAAFAASDEVALGAMPLRVPDRPLVPYRDYLVEYPPGFFLWALPLAALVESAAAYSLLFSVWMGVLLTVAIVFCRRIARRLDGSGADRLSNRLVLWTTLALIAVGAIAIRRYDAVISALLCAACWALIARRPVWCGIALAVAIASKGVPVLLGPLFLIYLLRLRDRRGAILFLVAGVVTSAILFLPPILLCGGGLFDAVRYHGIRPLQIESSGAALLGVWRIVEPASLVRVHSFGSTNVVGRYASALLALSGPATLVGILLVYLRAWRHFGDDSDPRRRDLDLLASVAAVLVIFMACSKVFSPQYLVWLLPLGVLISIAQGGARGIVFLAILTLTQLIFPAAYHQLEDLAPWASGLVLLRTGLLLYWSWSGLHSQGVKRTIGAASSGGAQA